MGLCCIVVLFACASGRPCEIGRQVSHVALQKLGALVLLSWFCATDQPSKESQYNAHAALQ